ncbi:MAG TPA: glycosyltransferase [Bacteroidales bacterium]|nr:glycosyltransferase [Bacteroidales bacterium]
MQKQIYNVFMPSRVLITVSNDIATDSRVLRFAGILADGGDHVLISGRRLKGSLPVDHLPYKCRRFNMLFKRSFMFYASLNIRLFFFLLFSKFDILVSVDLDTLPAGYLVSLIKSKKLVFDSHEYFTGVPELRERKFVRGFWKSIERIILPQLSYIITVNDSISELYRGEYGSECVVIRNVSERYVGPVMAREMIGASDDELLLVLQGRGLNMGNGGEPLIEAIRDIDRVRLMIIGGGDRLKKLKVMAEKDTLKSKIIFFPVMSWERMMSYTAAADVGVAMFEPGCTNLDLCLPNKLFEYIGAGLAVLANELKEISLVLNKYDCGVAVEYPDRKNIAEALLFLRDNPDRLKEMKRNSLTAFGDLNWKKESAKLKSLISLVKDRT